MATLKLGTTTAITESGGVVTLANMALGTPTSATLTNATFPDGVCRSMDFSLERRTVLHPIVEL